MQAFENEATFEEFSFIFIFSFSSRIFLSWDQIFRFWPSFEIEALNLDWEHTFIEGSFSN